MTPNPLYAQFVQRLADGVPWAFSRWGDGEWACLLGRSGATCDGQRYSGRLRADLARVLCSGPAYDLGLQGFAVRRYGPAIAAWLARRRLDLEWVDADVFAHESIERGLDGLFSALASRNNILVGPARLAPVARLVPLRYHVTVPLTDAHAVADEIVRVTADLAPQYDRPVVLVSAGPAAKVVVHELHALLWGAALLDVGSIWEPYIGLATRTYHARILERVQ